MTRMLSVLVFAACLAACGDPGTPAQDPAGEPNDPPSVVRTAAVPVDSVTVRTHARLVELAQRERLYERPIGEIVQRFAHELLGKPYVEHMLDQSDDEELVVSLAGFDCVLYMESVLAMALAVRVQDYSIDAFARNVENIRYRGGERGDYCTRLHYFTDWLYDNHQRGNIRLITDELPASRAFDKRIDFMTEHRSAYRHLADDDDMLACIAEVQQGLNQRRLTYVPQDRVTEVYDHLQAGDFIAFTTTVGGLDAAHTAFVYKYPDGRTGMIHASTSGEVRREPDLARYVQGVRIQNGIMVARPVDPGSP